MQKYKFTKKAETQIHDVFEYSMLNFGKLVAEKYFTSLEICFQMLATNPEIGRISASIRDDIRRHEHLSHVIFYKISDEGILIGAILHKRSIKQIRF